MKPFSSVKKVSVIVPALNEAELIARLLARLRVMPQVCEIIVCDGGSRDETRDIARICGALVIECKANRGAQMNAGAQIARGEILWFLHADAWPPRSGAQRIVAACSQLKPQHRVLDVHRRSVRRFDVRHKTVVGGNFRLRFDSSRHNSVRVAARVFAALARVLRKFGVYYGDSGIWVRREVFEKLGGCQNWPLFEDYEMARRLEKFARQNGCKTFCIASPIIVSSRRFGTSTRSATNLLIRWAKLQLLFWCGVAPEKLAKMYRKSSHFD